MLTKKIRFKRITYPKTQVIMVYDGRKKNEKLIDTKKWSEYQRLLYTIYFETKCESELLGQRAVPCWTYRNEARKNIGGVNTTTLDGNSIENVCSKRIVAGTHLLIQIYLRKRYGIKTWRISTVGFLAYMKLWEVTISPRALQILINRELTMIRQIIALMITLKPSKLVTYSPTKIVMIEEIYWVILLF